MTANNGALLSAPFDARGKRVLVYSLGIEGRDLARWMLARGARVTISDTRTDDALDAAGAVPPGGIECLVTGQDFLDPAGFDLVAVSQSVLRYDRALGRARELGIPVTSQMRLFLQLCSGKVIGITGSSGKSTTTALVGAIAAETGLPFIVGGNIGEALLGRLDEITPETNVILEISHTQLQYTDRSPAIAAVTNITPNHLDQFSWDEYVGLKRNIIAHQHREDVAVLNADDQTSRALMASVRGRLVRTSINSEPEGDGAWLDHEEVVLRHGKRVVPAVMRTDIRLRGAHNLANAVMACAIAAEAGFPPEAMARGVRAFRGVPIVLKSSARMGAPGSRLHRHQPERTIAGSVPSTSPWSSSSAAARRTSRSTSSRTSPARVAGQSSASARPDPSSTMR